MAAPIQRVWHRFIVHFVNEHIEFRIPELDAVVRTVNTQIRYASEYNKLNPFLIVDLPSRTCALKISQRAVLIRSIYEYWANGPAYTNVLHQVKELSAEFLKPFTQADTTLRCVVDGYNKKIPQDEKMTRIQPLMDILDSRGSIDLKCPQHSIHVLEYYDLDSQKLENVYVGNWIADGQRSLSKRYNLQERFFIGNTSMDPGLSLIMANMASVQPNHLVMDPFVGTGSLMVSSAHFGAYVMGTDIDYMLLHGRARPSRCGDKVRAEGECVRANFSQYDMTSQCLDVMVADSSQHLLFRQDLRFDAIITDPPYGIRESCIKVGAQDNPRPFIPEDARDRRIPSKEKYTLSSIFTDLMVFAAKFLCLHGRLVYWLPVNRDKYTSDSVPRHPCLSEVANCEQPITFRIGRRLVTMEKVKEFQNEPAIESEEMKAHLDSFRFDCFLPTEAEVSLKQRKRARKAAEKEKAKADMKTEKGNLSENLDGRKGNLSENLDGRTELEHLDIGAAAIDNQNKADDVTSFR